MTGQRGLNGNLGRFQIPDFPHHHHIRILTQDGTKPSGKSHVHLGVDLGLAYPLKIVFDRIFNRQDIAILGVDFRQRRIEGGTLTRTCRSGNQNDAVGLANKTGDLLPVWRRHPELLELQTHIVLVEQTHNHPLAIA